MWSKGTSWVKGIPHTERRGYSRTETVKPMRISLSPLPSSSPSLEVRKRQKTISALVVGGGGEGEKPSRVSKTVEAIPIRKFNCKLQYPSPPLV